MQQVLEIRTWIAAFEQLQFDHERHVSAFCSDGWALRVARRRSPLYVPRETAPHAWGSRRPGAVTHRLFWPRSRNARCASTCVALWPVGAAKGKRLFTRAARKETVLPVRSAIMPIPSEVAPYDFRP